MKRIKDKLALLALFMGAVLLVLLGVRGNSRRQMLKRVGQQTLDDTLNEQRRIQRAQQQAMDALPRGRDATAQRPRDGKF